MKCTSSGDPCSVTTLRSATKNPCLVIRKLFSFKNLYSSCATSALGLSAHHIKKRLRDRYPSESFSGIPNSLARLTSSISSSTSSCGRDLDIPLKYTLSPSTVNSPLSLRTESPSRRANNLAIFFCSSIFSLTTLGSLTIEYKSATFFASCTAA